uniref:Leucine-rich repeat containing protein n=1 Tax=Rhizophora mucronata TaxID=61149 RepID=A0A2P2JZB4_RHIMU
MSQIITTTDVKFLETDQLFDIPRQLSKREAFF